MSLLIQRAQMKEVQDEVNSTYFMRWAGYRLTLLGQCKYELPFTQSMVQWETTILCVFSAPHQAHASLWHPEDEFWTLPIVGSTTSSQRCWQQRNCCFSHLEMTNTMTQPSQEMPLSTATISPQIGYWDMKYNIRSLRSFSSRANPAQWRNTCSYERVVYSGK